MIRYDLTCTKGHGFDGWFRDSAAFDAQQQDGLLACPVCGDAKVSKALMAPRIARRDREATRQAAPVMTGEMPHSAPDTPPPDAPVALLGEKERELRAALRHVRRLIEEKTEDVGRRFPDEALKMHEGEIEHRPIRGIASPEEVQSLTEAGVEISPVPSLPDDGN